jgi:excisionase family DNA binding protein
VIGAGRISRNGQGFGATADGHEIAYRSANAERRTMSTGHASDEKLLTKGEVALLCRVEIRTVDRWVASGKLRFYRTPSGRLLFREADVLVIANRSSQVAQTDSDQPALL